MNKIWYMMVQIINACVAQKSYTKIKAKQFKRHNFMFYSQSHLLQQLNSSTKYLQLLLHYLPQNCNWSRK